MVGLYFNFAEELLLLNIQFWCIRHAHTDTSRRYCMHCMWPLSNSISDALCAYRELECATRLVNTRFNRRAWHYSHFVGWGIFSGTERKGSCGCGLP